MCWTASATCIIALLGNRSKSQDSTLPGEPASRGKDLAACLAPTLRAAHIVVIGGFGCHA
jgi:hypothetical protein